MKNEIKIILLVMKELGFNEIKIKPETMLNISDESIEVEKRVDGSLILKRQGNSQNIESCKFEDIKKKLAAWLVANKPKTFTLNKLLDEVFEINSETATHTERERIGLALAELGWKRTSRNKINGKRQFVYGQE